MVLSKSGKIAAVHSGDKSGIPAIGSAAYAWLL